MAELVRELWAYSTHRSSLDQEDGFLHTMRRRAVRGVCFWDIQEIGWTGVRTHSLLYYMSQVRVAMIQTGGRMVADPSLESLHLWNSQDRASGLALQDRRTIGEGEVEPSIEKRPAGLREVSLLAMQNFHGWYKPRKVPGYPTNAATPPGPSTASSSLFPQSYFLSAGEKLREEDTRVEIVV